MTIEEHLDKIVNECVAIQEDSHLSYMPDAFVALTDIQAAVRQIQKSVEDYKHQKGGS